MLGQAEAQETPANSDRGAPARRRARRSGARQGSYKGARRLVCGGQRAARRCVLASLRFGSAVHPSLMLHRSTRSTLRTREQILEANPRIAPLSVFALRARLRLAAAPGSAQTRSARRGGCARKHHAAEHRWSVPYEHSRIQGSAPVRARYGRLKRCVADDHAPTAAKDASARALAAATDAFASTPAPLP